MAVDVDRQRAAWRQSLEQRATDLRAIFAICKAFSLKRGDRIEFATVMLNREVDSYSDLDPAEVARLRAGYEGAVLVCKFQMERRRGERV